jgi:integrase
MPKGMLQDERPSLRRQRRLTGKTRWLFPARLTFPGGWAWVDRPIGPTRMLDWLKPVRAALANFSRGHAWHLLRHTFATDAARRRVPTVKLAGWMGHSDIRMTERYVHFAAGYDPDIEPGRRRT